MAPPPRKTDIKALTGVRGIAACMVVLYHYFQDSAGFGPLHTIIAHSYSAVDLFFVLSGFVMALTYAPSFAGRFSLADYGAFLGKRLGRVYPLYLVVTLLVAGLVYSRVIEGAALTVGVLASNVLMVQAWGFADSIGGPTWSISTEFAAYLLFPVFVALVLSGHVFRSWLAAVCAVATLTTLAGCNAATLNQIVNGAANRSGPLDIFGTGTLFPLLRCLAGFTLGLVAFRLLREHRHGRIFAWRHFGDAAALLVLLLWATRGLDVALELAFVPFVMALAVGRAHVAKVLGGAIVVWLGEVSYSIYLVHRPVENILRKPLMALLNAHHVPHAYTAAGIIPLALTILIAAATFYGVEKPARDWTRRLMRDRASPIGPEPAAP